MLPQRIQRCFSPVFPLEVQHPPLTTAFQRIRNAGEGGDGVTRELTDTIKKSWCNTETIPKFVNLKTRSMIHIKWGRTFFFALKVAISNGTSAVDWWLATTSVLSSRQFLMSSPISTTKKKQEKKGRRMKIGSASRAVCLFHSASGTDRHTRRTNSTSPPWPAASEKTIPLSSSTTPDDISSPDRVSSSRQHTWECSTRYLKWRTEPLERTCNISPGVWKRTSNHCQMKSGTIFIFPVSFSNSNSFRIMPDPEVSETQEKLFTHLHDKPLFSAGCCGILHRRYFELIKIHFIWQI